MLDHRTATADTTTANSPDKPIITQPWEDYDTVLRHADRARTNGDTMRARTFYTRLAELNPNDARGWTGLAETAASLDEAIMSWAYVLALTPSDLEARAQMDAHLEERITESGVADAAVLVALARTLVEVGQKPAANRVLVRATELDPTNGEAWLWRAGVTEDQNDAIASLKQVLSMDPENAQAKAGLKWAQAQELQSKTPVSTDDTKNAINFFEEGQQALRENNMTQAHDLFKRATELDPNNESAWFWRGSTTQDVDEAIACMDHTLAINPHNQAAKDTKWWLGVKKYRELFNAQVAPAPMVSPNTAEPIQAIPPEPPKTSWHIALILFFFVIISVLLGVIVFWRLVLS